MKLLPKVSLHELKKSLQNVIDREAEEIRTVFITPGDGQMFVYCLKLQEARQVISHPNTKAEDVPHISAEVGVTGNSLQAVANVVLASYKEWATVSSRIERIRLIAKAGIKKATTVEDARRAAKVNWQLTPKGKE